MSKNIKLKKDLTHVKGLIKIYNLDELAEIRKFIEAESMAKLYGLKGRLSDSVLAMRFVKKHSHMVAKNELAMGRYEILIRPPEHSTLKLDLHDESKETKQIRIFFTLRDWQKITGL